MKDEDGRGATTHSKSLAATNSAFILRRSSAFTLLEVLIAVIILAGAMLWLLTSLAENFNQVEAIRNTNTATELLALKLAELQQLENLETGSQDGDFEETHPGFSWITEIEPDPELTDLYAVKITVSWTERGQTASDSVQTMMYRASEEPKNISSITKKLGQGQGQTRPLARPHR